MYGIVFAQCGQPIAQKKYTIMSSFALSPNCKVLRDAFSVLSFNCVLEEVLLLGSARFEANASESISVNAMIIIVPDLKLRPSTLVLSPVSAK